MKVPRHEDNAEDLGAPYDCRGYTGMAGSPQNDSADPRSTGECGGDACRAGSPEDATEDPGAPDHCRGHAQHNQALLWVHTATGLQTGYYHGTVHCTQ